MISGKNIWIDLFAAVWLCLFGVPVGAAEIWVSPHGSPDGDGTASQPFAAVDQALRKARELRRLADPAAVTGITIILKDGVYRLDETIFIRPEDSGTAQRPTVVRAEPGARPVLSGGRTITGWRRAGKVDGILAGAAGRVWVTDAPHIAGSIVDFRQL